MGANFNFNHITLGGRLTATPELKTTTNGTTVCAFTVAVNRRGKEQTTDFINCVSFKGTAEFISKYFTKGSSICVVGSLQVRSYTDKDGNKRTATDVLVESAHFVDGKNDNASGQTETQPEFNTVAKMNFEVLGEDEDIPFN